MERLGSVEEMKARLAQLQEKASAEHFARMAELPPGTCDRCYGSGRIGCYPCGCVEGEQYADGTPVEFQQARFDNYRPIDGNGTAIAKGRAFLEKGAARDLYLCGGIGAGKTRLAASILNEAHRRGKWCYFARVPMMLHQLQPGRPSEELEHKLTRCDLVLFDDLGAERDQATDYTRRTLLMLYEERGDRGHRSIFTSNKTIQELSDMQDDDRLASRIAGRADVVKLTTPDQRMVRRAKESAKG
jgi:DNA replication protein DnaC